MDGVTLLAEAHAAGLTVQADGGKLIVRGPRSAEPVARRLIENKTAVIQALTMPDLPPRPVPRHGCVVELARSRGRWVWRQRWSDGADRAYWAWTEPGEG